MKYFILFGISITAAYFLRANFTGFTGLLVSKIFSNTYEKKNDKELGFDIDNASILSDCRNYYNWSNEIYPNGWCDDSFFMKFSNGAFLTFLFFILLSCIF